MNKGEYFKIDTVEELKEAYEMFKDKWWENFTLEEEIENFETTRARHIVKDEVGDVYLNLKDWIEHYDEIPSSLKKQKEKSSLQKTLEIGDLNIRILNYLTANDIVDSSLCGQGAQNIVDKIDELSRIILK